jgi:hypothetical protein
MGAFLAPVRCRLYSGLESFMSARPLTIRIAASTRNGLAVSPRTATPTTKAPTAPMPVHTAYAVPSGSDRIDQASSPKLSSIEINMMVVGQGRVNPSDCFMAKAQTTSNRPAIRSISQSNGSLRVLSPLRPNTLARVRTGLFAPTHPSASAFIEGMASAQRTSGRVSPHPALALLMNRGVRRCIAGSGQVNVLVDILELCKEVVRRVRERCLGVHQALLPGTLSQPGRVTEGPTT